MAREELNFLEFMQSFRRGELLREADDRMSEVLAAIQETGNSGEVTVVEKSPSVRRHVSCR